MSRARIRWLYEELPDLVRRGVLDDAAARRLRSHYGPVTAGPDPRAVRLAIFGVLGASLVAAGVVLLLAHNWEDLSRPARAALAFGLLLAAQGLAAWVLLRRRGSVAWVEGSAAALTGAVVACIALVAQTYHLPGDLTGLLFTWALLTVPVAWSMDSAVATAAVWAIAGGWVVLAPGGAQSPEAVGWLLPAALVAPRLFRAAQRGGPGRAALVGWAAGLSALAALVRLVAVPVNGLWLPSVSGFFGVALVLGLAWERRGASGWSWTLRPFATLGRLGLGGLLLALGIGDLWRDVRPLALTGAGAADWVRVAVAAALVAASVWGAVHHLRRGRTAVGLLAAVPGWVASCFVARQVGPVPADALGVGSHLLAVAIGVAALVEGLRSLRLGEANAGLVLVAAVALLRFFDPEVPFVVRGLGFIAVGAGFLALNVRMVRRRGATS